MQLKKIMQMIWLFAAISASAQNQPYQGGNADGAAQAETVTPFSFPTSFQPYIGGTAAGHNKAEIINTVFPFPNHFYVFAGGANDGWTGNLAPGIVILPLTLFQFRGEAQNTGNVLYWSTDNEINTSHFLVERSTNGNNFSPMAQRQARGNYSGRTEYRLVDSFPLSGKNFYRIKMWDKDSSFKYSPTIVLEKQKLVKALLVFPNPVSQKLQIKLNEPANGAIQWNVYDVTGRRLITERTNSLLQLYHVNVSQLPAGTYMLEVEFDNRKETIQFSKQ